MQHATEKVTFPISLYCSMTRCENRWGFLLCCTNVLCRMHRINRESVQKFFEQCSTRFTCCSFLDAHWRVISEGSSFVCSSGAVCMYDHFYTIFRSMHCSNVLTSLISSCFSNLSCCSHASIGAKCKNTFVPYIRCTLEIPRWPKLT